MANRTVSVALKAEIGQYVAGMSKASAATMRLGESARDSQAQASKHFDLAGKGALIMGGAIVAGVGLAVAKSMEFEKSMSAVAAATQATGGTLEALRATALKAGADTAYSATEAADGITEMAKAGVSAKDIMGGGLAGALALAAAGQISVADAAGIASTAMTQFSLSGKDLPHVADLLAAGAGKAMGSVDDLGMALNQAGLIAASSGLSIEETTGTLAAFASAGLLGSDAGTSMKTMLQKLQAPSKEAAQIMGELGINMYDANGNMLDMAGMAGQLQGHMAGLSQEQRNNALATIFGSDAVRAANVLYKEGAQGIQEWTRKTDDAGFAAKQAAALQDNLAGDLEKLGGSFDTLMISIGHGVQGPLRGLTEMVTGLLNGAGSLVGVFAGLPGPVQAAVLGFGAWAVAGDRVTGMFGKVKDGMRAFTETQELQRALLSAQNSTLSDTERALGGLGTQLDNTSGKFGLTKAAIGSFAQAIGPELGVAAAVYGISSVASSLDGIMHAGDAARAEVRDLNRSLGDIDSNDAHIEAVAQAITDLTHKLADAQAIAGNSDDLVSSVFNPIALGDAISKYKDAGSSVDVYRKAIADLEGQQRRATAATEGLSAQYGITNDDVLRLADTYGIDLTAGMDSVNRVFINSGAAAEVAAGGVTSVGNAAGMTQTQIEDAAKAIEDWLGQLQQIGASFVEPLSIYEGLLQEKQQAEQASAQATADATKSSKDSWKDYVTNSTVSLDEWAAALQQKLTDQATWQANIVTITQRGGLEVGQAFAAMGVDAATQTAQMANATDAEFQRMAGLIAQDAAAGGAGAAAALDTQMKVMAAVAAAGGKATVQSIAAELGVGVGVVAGIFAQYSNSVAGGVNPLLLALGKPTLAGYHVAGLNGGPGGTQTKASGGYISGPGSGTSDSIPARLSNGEFVVRASQTAKHLPLLHALNSGLPGYAGGGYVTAADVPKPYSTAPYSGAVGAPGSGGMTKEYDEARAFITNAMGAMMGGGPAGAGVQRWLPLVLASLNLVGQPGSLAQTVLRRMQQESGGNPRAINLTDINAKRGTPSKGLMQVIDPTFRAYAMAGHNRDIWDPLSNLLASERYAMARYGSLSAAYNKAGGYDEGGLATGAGYLAKATVSPERVLSPRQTEAFESWMSREVSGGQGGVSAAAVAQLVAQAVAGVAKSSSRSGPLVNVEKQYVGDTVDMDLVLRQAEFRQRQSVFS